jgi:hypothetical protein
MASAPSAPNRARQLRSSDDSNSGGSPQIELANPEKSLTSTIEPQADLSGRRRRQSHDRFGQCRCQCCNRRARPPTKKRGLLSKAIRGVANLWLVDV